MWQLAELKILKNCIDANLRTLLVDKIPVFGHFLTFPSSAVKCHPLISCCFVIGIVFFLGQVRLDKQTDVSHIVQSVQVVTKYPGMVASSTDTLQLNMSPSTQ